MYQGGSDENFSFKSAVPLPPTAAIAAVRSHEGELASNAYKKEALNNGKVVSTSLFIYILVCLECERNCVFRGTTHFSIKYYKDSVYEAKVKRMDVATVKE